MFQRRLKNSLPYRLLASPAARQRNYAEILAPRLKKGETVLDAGTSVWLEYARVNGRGRGEGVLGFTEEHLYFQGTSEDLWMAIPLDSFITIGLQRSSLRGAGELRFSTPRVDQVTLVASEDFLNDALERLVAQGRIR